MLKKSLFEDTVEENFTQEGKALDIEIADALKPIMDKYINKGYRVRDIENIALCGTWQTCIWQHLMRK